MTGKSGVKFGGALALLTMLSTASVDAGLKQLEIKGATSLGGYGISYNNGTNAIRNGGSDSTLNLNADLDFKMKFSQDVSARIDFEMDGAQAGDSTLRGKSASTASKNIGNRYTFGIDQAFFKMNDFLFRNFSLSLGKQNLNMSLRDNKSFAWAWGDPIALVGSYSTRDLDLKAYFAKYNDGSDLSSQASSNDEDDDLIGVYGEYWLNDDSLVIGYLNYKSVDSSQSTAATPLNANIVHYGIGLDYFIGESLEIYGEIAGQSIDIAGGIDGSAFQVTLGGEYAFSDYDMKPTINLEYYLQSGRDSGDPAWANIAGGAASAENQSLFVEGTSRDAAVNRLNFGAGLVSYGGASVGTGGGGYSVIRLNGWISPSKSTKVGLGGHIFTSEDTIAGGKDDLGLELDLKGSWKYSQDVSFQAGAFLWQGGDYNGSAAATTGDYEDVTGFTVSSTLSF